MKAASKEIPGYTPLPPEDLRIFPPYVSLFLANIFITMITTVCIIPPVLNLYTQKAELHAFGIIIVLNLIVSILSIVVLRGNLFPIKLLSVLNSCLAVLAIAAIFIGESKFRNSIIIGAIAAVSCYLIIRSEKYRQIALFWQRMMDRQRATGLTRAEDIQIHLELEEGTKEGFKHAKYIVMSARERLNKSPQ